MQQFARGVRRRGARRFWRAACRQTAHPFTGLVYRQVLEYLHGVRDEAATRALIVQREPPLRAPSVDLVQERA